MLLSAFLSPLEADPRTVYLAEDSGLDSGGHWIDSDGPHHRDYHCLVTPLSYFRIVFSVVCLLDIRFVFLI